jgi:hypothetical protein
VVRSGKRLGSHPGRNAGGSDHWRTFTPARVAGLEAQAGQEPWLLGRNSGSVTGGGGRGQQ